MALTTLHSATVDTLDRLGDTQEDVWSREEIELYLVDGYNEFCARTKCLFDIFAIDTSSPAGNWQTDLEKYLAEQRPGWNLTDEPFHVTAEHEKLLGTAGRLANSYRGPIGHTSPTDADTVVRPVTGGTLPSGTVEVQRVTFNRRELEGVSSAHMRQLDPLYETKEGDPRFFTYDKDGINYLRVVPALTDPADYEEVRGSWGTRTYEFLPDGLVAMWKMDETSGARADSVGAYDLSSVNSVTAVSGVRGQAASFTAASQQLLTRTPQIDLDGSLGITITYWITIKAGAPTGVTFFSNGATYISSISLGTSNVSPLVQYFGVMNDAGSSVSAGAALGSYDTRYFVVGRYDPATAKPSISVNAGAVTEGSALPGGDPMIDTGYGAGVVYVGGSPSHSFYGDCIIDEVRLYNRLLDDTEVTDLYNSGAATEFTYDSSTTLPTISTTEPNGYNTGGFGALTYLTGAFPTLGPWGTITRLHPTDGGISVDVARLGRDFTDHPSELPPAYQKYVTYWAMATALKREGPGQDLALSAHFAERFEMGVDRLTKKVSRFSEERVRRLRGPNTASAFGIGDPSLPSNYPAAF